MDSIKTTWIENLYTSLIIFYIFLRILSIIRVAKDIWARTNNTTLQIISILLVTFFSPVIGIPLYHIIKPVWYKKDRLPWREVFISNSSKCQKCWTINSKEYNCCIRCWEKLKITCKECWTEYPHNYQFCFKCWAPNIE